MDNNQNYRWQPEDKITITGAQFDSLQRFVAVMGEVLTAFIPDAMETRKQIIEQMIEQGVAKAYTEGEPEAEAEVGPEQPTEEAINPS